MSAPAFDTINCFVFDVDGVLTDGSVLVLENGLQARRMSIRDGYALQLAVKKGYRVLIMSGAVLGPVEQRLQKLGITEVHMGVLDKPGLLRQYLLQHQLRKEEILFMGDDMPDLAVMGEVGLPTCPADAVAEVQAAASYVSPVPGGSGCVRDVIERVLKVKGDWQHEADVASK